MFHILTIFLNFLFLIAGFRMSLKTMSDLDRISQNITRYEKAEFGLLRCAQEKSNRKNIEHAYRYLAKMNRDHELVLRQTKDQILDALGKEESGEFCYDEMFPYLRLGTRRQNYYSFPFFWPNWVPSYEIRN
ncbi:MAG: hypothetical protein KA436_10210 [Oligoflexales bacterium]|nr:hypothetical protein [Oligoflexales bacterium]